MALHFPFLDSPYPQYEAWLVRSSDMSQITELEVHNKKLQLQLDNQGSFTGWVHLLDEATTAIEPLSTAIRLDRNGKTVYSGQVWTANDSSSASGVGQQSGSDQCQITSYGWFNVLGGSGGISGYNGRLVHTGAEFQQMIYVNGTNSSDGYMPNYLLWRETQNGGVDYAQLGIDTAVQLAYDAVEYPQTTDAAIIFDLLDRANIDSPTYIVRGGIAGSPVQRNLTLQRFEVVGQEIQQLVNVEAGVDWVIDPVTREMNLYGVGASPSPLIANGYGVDRGQGCLFSYPGNCVSMSRSRDGAYIQNRVEAVGQYGVGRADNVASQQVYGLLEAQDSLSEVTDPNILAAYANEEVAVLGNPYTVFTMTPRGTLAQDAGVSSVPHLFVDFEIGDIVYAYIDRGSVQVGTSSANPQPMRMFGATLTIDDNGIERLTQIVTSYNGLGQST